jgi:hypothetical protein
MVRKGAKKGRKKSMKSSVRALRGFIAENLFDARLSSS